MKAPTRFRSLLASTLAAAAATSLGALAAHAQPAPSDKAAPTARPAWCDTYGFDPTTAYGLRWFDGMSIDALADNPSVGGAFAEIVCATKLEWPGDRAPLMALRAQWMERMGYDERDFAVIAAESLGHVDPRQKPSTLAGAGAQLSDDNGERAFLRLDELGARASMLARFDAIDGCFEASLGVRKVRETTPLRLVQCAGEPLDRAKAYAEIDAIPGLNGGTRKELRAMVKRAHDSALVARALVAEAAKEEPGFAKLVAMADDIRKAWASPTPARAALIAQLEAMEAARASNKRSAFASCAAPTHAAWTAHLATVKLPRLPDGGEFGALRGAALDGADGYLAYRALRLCADGVSASAAGDGDELGPAYTFRGPRTEMLAAWMAAAGEIAFDDRALDLTKLLQLEPALRFPDGTFLGRPSRGTIAAIEPAGDAVRVTFKRTTATIDGCTDWRATNRIERIDDQGIVHYRQECKRWGKVKLDTTAEPVVISAVSAEGLAPGMLLVAHGSLAVAATSGAKSSVPTWVLGAPVK